ncbi:hypothetical protein [Streptomyces sp. NPDC059761]|uniref:hypothetical protein n=1 Tax=Streptomyces sp. NPDC059761 TaxID=3346937 RepID=UPI0036496635
MSTFRNTVSRNVFGALAGLLSGFTALAVAELVADLVRPAVGPVTVVGGAAIDRTPAAVKDFAIRTFGERTTRSSSSWASCSRWHCSPS